MFFCQPIPWKAEVVVNLMGPTGYGRGRFLEERYGLGHSEVWEVRRRVLEAMEPRSPGRPRRTLPEDSSGPCPGCKERDERIQALVASYATAREKGKRHLALEAAVAPCSAPTIAALQMAAFNEADSPDTILRLIDKAGARALAIHNSFPWAEKLERAAVDELFAGKTPILVGVEPRSMAVPFLQRGPDRTAKTWQEVLGRFPNLKEIASDQAPAILAAGTALGLLLQGDWFHSHEELRQCLGALERQALKRISEEYKALAEVKRRKELRLPTKRAAKNYRRAKKVARKAMERHDRARQAEPLFEKAMSLFDESGHWVSFSESRELIEKGLALLREVEAPYRRKVARAYEPDRILNFKAVLEVPLDTAEDLPELSMSEMIEVAVATMHRRPGGALWAGQPSELRAAIAWDLAQVLDQKLTTDCPSWPEHRARIQEEIGQPFRSSSWVECFNSRLRVAQQVLKHLGPNLLALLMLSHNATPFTAGKRRGQTPLEILGFEAPPGSWRDWVLAA